MTIPGSPTLEGSPYGAQPVVPLIGPQGGPYRTAAPLATTLLPSAARTATQATAIQQNPGYKGVLVHFRVTVNPGGAQTLKVEIFQPDPLGVADVLVMTVPASATPGGDYAIYPGLSGAAVEGFSLTRNMVLGGSYYALVTHSGVGAWTYSLGTELLP